MWAQMFGPWSLREKRTIWYRLLLQLLPRLFWGDLLSGSVGLRTRKHWWTWLPKWSNLSWHCESFYDPLWLPKWYNGSPLWSDFKVNQFRACKWIKSYAILSLYCCSLWKWVNDLQHIDCIYLGVIIYRQVGERGALKPRSSFHVQDVCIPSRSVKEIV